MSSKLQPKSSNHNSNCQHDATNQTTPIRCTSAAKQLDDRVEPKARAQSQQTLISICRLMPPIRRHQLECPRTRAQISCNHCSQQLLARCCQTYRRHQADRTPMKPALHDFRLTGSAWSVKWRFCPPLAHVLRSLQELVRRIPSPAHVPRLLQEHEMCSITGAGAANTARVDAICSTTGAGTSSIRVQSEETRPTRRCICTKIRPSTVSLPDKKSTATFPQALRGLSCTFEQLSNQAAPSSRQPWKSTLTPPLFQW